MRNGVKSDWMRQTDEYSLIWTSILATASPHSANGVLIT